jgi:hypothetical protein
MKFIDRWLYGKVRDMWDNRHKYEKDGNVESKGINVAAGLAIPKGLRNGVDGQDRMSFELSSAIGGRILNVSRYDPRIDRIDQQTYVIPSGEDVGARVAKILNLELLK